MNSRLETAREQIDLDFPDATLYLFNEYYLDGLTGFPLDRVARVTIRCLATWADRFQAFPIHPRGSTRQGVLPVGREQRVLYLEEILNWLENVTDDISVAELILYEQDRCIFNGHDGFPGNLILTAEQYTSLQQCWEAEHMPNDLYYPVIQQRVVVEPTPFLGTVIRLQKKYGPRAWEHRDSASIEALQVPSEDERRKRFQAACSLFSIALSVRQMELREAGHPDKGGAIKALGEVNQRVMELALRGDV